MLRPSVIAATATLTVVAVVVGVELRFGLGRAGEVPALSVTGPERVQHGREDAVRIELSEEADPSTLRVEVNGEDRSHGVRFGSKGATVVLRDLDRGANRVRVKVRDREGGLHEREVAVEALNDPLGSRDAELRRTVQGILAIQRSRQRRAHPPGELVELIEQGAGLVRGLEEAATTGLRTEGERERIRDAARAVRDRAAEARDHYGQYRERLPTRGAERRRRRFEVLQETVSGAGRRAAAALEAAAAAATPGELRKAREVLTSLTRSPHPPPSPLPPPPAFPAAPPDEHPLRTHVHEAALQGERWYAGQGGEDSRALLDEPVPARFRRRGLAQIQIGPPAALAQTPDPDLLPATGVRFDLHDPDDPIVRKAEELGHDPIAIYEFVRNEIEFELYGGLARGATATLLGRRGNNPDQVALLVALLRASGYPARFVVGDIAAGVEAVQQWLQIPTVKGVRDHLAWYVPRPTFDNAPGVADDDFILYEHWWAKVLVPYGPDQGRDLGAPMRWIFLDPSFKQHDTDLTPEVELPFAGSDHSQDEVVDFSFQGGAGMLGSITAKTPVELYADQKRETLREIAPGKTLEDVSIRGPIIEKRLGFLPASLPYRPLAYHLDFADVEELPDVDLPSGADRKDLLRPRFFVRLMNTNSRGHENCTVQDPCLVDPDDPPPCLSSPFLFVVQQRCIPIKRSFIVADMATERISVGWEPADATSAAILQSQCHGDLFLCPDPGAVALRPVLYRDGVPVVGNPDIAKSDITPFRIGEPPLAVLVGTSSVLDQAEGGGFPNLDELTGLPVGSRWVASVDFGQGTDGLVDRAATDLITAFDSLASSGKRLQGCTPDSNTCAAVALEETEKESLIGGLLHVGALRYGERVREGWRTFGELEQIRVVGNGRGQAQATLHVQYLDSTPVSVVPDALLIDMPYLASPFDLQGVSPYTRHEEIVHRLVLLDASAKEHQLWEELTQIESISTVKGLQFANDPTESASVEVLKLQKGDPVPPGPAASVIEGLLAQDFTVYTPNLGVIDFREWSGTVYYAEHFTNRSRSVIAAIAKTGSGAANGGFTAESDPISTFSRVERFSPIGADVRGVRAGDPVNVISGNLDHSETDIELPTVGARPVALTRTYNSQLQESGPFGYRWTHSYRLLLEAVDDDADGTPGEPEDDDGIVSAIALVDGSGGRRRFRVTSGSLGVDPTFDGEAGEHGVLVREGGALVLRTRNGSDFEFPVFSAEAGVGGQVLATAIVDPNGNRTTLSHQGGRVAAVTDPLGRKLHLRDDDGDGRVDRVVDWSGRTWTYLYSGEDLVEVRNPVDAAAGRATSTYQYYSDQFASANNHNLRRRENGRGEGMTYFYYLNDKVYKTVDDEGAETRFVYDAFRQESRQIDALERETLFQYDRKAQLVRIVRPDRSIESFAYDDDRNLISEVDALGGETRRTYDSFGNVKRETSPEGFTTEFVYWYEENPGTEPGTPRHSRFIERRDPKGNVFRFHYDPAGNLTRETVEMDPDGDGIPREVELRRHDYDPVGNRTKTIQNIDPVTRSIDESRDRVVMTTFDDRRLHPRQRIDAEGGVVRFVWDTDLGEPDRSLLRRVEQERIAEYPDGERQETTVVEDREYDLLGRLTLVRGPLGTERETVYDLAGRVKERIVRGRDASGSRRTRMTKIERDSQGRRTRVTDPLGNAMRRSYDLAGNLKKVVDRTGRATRFRYDARDRRVARIEPGGAVTRLERDALGRLVERVDPTGRRVRFAYDRDGFQTRQLQCAPVGECDPQQSLETRFFRDANGNRVGIQSPRLLAGEISTNGYGFSITFVYDELDRLVAIRDAENQLQRFELDLQGNATTITDRRHHAITQEFDRAGRLARRTHPLGRRERFTYDSMGNLIAMWDGANRVATIRYDLGNREARVHFPDDRDLVFGFDGFGNRVLTRSAEVTYTTYYDLLDRPLRRTDSRFGSALRFTWDAEGRLLSETGMEGGVTQRRYGPEGRLLAVRSPKGTEVERDYDAAGRLRAEHSSLGLSTRFVYDAFGRVDRIDGNGTLRDYSYDPNGNVKELERSGVTEVYTYDALDRLARVEYPDGTSQQFDYDAAGNRVHEDDRGIDRWHFYDAANRRTKTTSNANGTEVLRTYTYDPAHGGRASMTHTASGDIWTYTWDAAGQLAEVQGPGAEAWTYAYDALGQRVAQDAPEKAWAYVWAGGNRVAEYLGTNGSGGLHTRYVHGPGLDDLLLMEQAGTAWGIRRDRLSSVISVTDGDLAALNLLYEPWGATLGMTTLGAAPEVDLGFTGRPRDSNGLIQLRARYYDPTIGRFLSPDPMGPAGGMNLYLYADANPATLTDRRGLAPEIVRSPTETGLGMTGTRVAGEVVSGARNAGGSQGAPNPDPLGPNPGNFFKFEAFGVDVVTPLGGFEFSSGFFVGRDRAGNFQAGPFVEDGPAIGLGLSVDTLGVEFVGNIDQLDRSLSINLVVGAGPFNAQGNLNPTPPNPADGTRFFGEFANGAGVGASFGPLPIEGFGSFTQTRAFDVIGFGRRFFGQ